MLDEEREYNRDYREKNNAHSRKSKQKWRLANPELARQRAKEEAIKYKYGITQADYEQLLVDQNGCCAACLRPATMFKRNLTVDHCHNSKKIRGLLCTNCNVALGMCSDDPERLHALIEYLKKSA